MNPWDAINPAEMIWVPIDEKEPTDADLKWMEEQIEEFLTDQDPGDENGN